MLLLVKFSPRMSRKVTIPEVPESVEELQNILKEKLELQGSFALQYEDPDFNNAPCNLIDIHDLPPERAILHILWDETFPLVQQESDSVGSESSLDTAILSSRESFQSPSAFIRNHLRSVSEWPSPFPIPSFSYDVELRLRKGNEAYERTKKGITLTRDMKIDILDKISQAVFELKAYPDHDQIESVASDLISRHPCLREPGSETGYGGWKTSIKYKLGNYRSKLRQAGGTEVSINQRKRGSEDASTSPSLKRAKRGEINHLPDHPENYNDDSLENERLVLVEDFKRKNKNVALIRQNMELTFSLRRSEIVELQPMVSEILEHWPALFCEEEIREEFYRITNRNLLENFKEALQQNTCRLLKLYRARRTASLSEMDQVLNSLDQVTSDITAHRQTAALKGLPLYLRESQEKLFRTCLATDPDEEQTKGLTVGILTVLEDDDTTVPQSVVSVAVVVEEEIVLQDLPDLPTAFAYLFGLIYALNIQYPKDLKYTFETVQKVFMELGADLSARVRSLKNKLVQ
ncbi:uncharacterized protein LOC130905771 [Corythoichthys intestinalis]|uniref:uncharacterized protein LOC130905771 n=1 Tax=Corythoichthys intestinalis TaxID=161448 RepID=UPI0025A62056|nr:uncharacterized protein LOC130905771 [Corythoichthys intestinalis]XP_057675417.1 uncharacterized protein LOC130905771 [Corythoichthys intestinalis]XP_057675418.1 uncharacterized protein LOC130905771 [Corythoichthys intestinalis]